MFGKANQYIEVMMLREVKEWCKVIILKEGEE